jgi:hypothetical protein
MLVVLTIARDAFAGVVLIFELVVLGRVKHFAKTTLGTTDYEERKARVVADKVAIEFGVEFEDAWNRCHGEKLLAGEGQSEAVEDGTSSDDFGDDFIGEAEDGCWEEWLFLAVGVDVGRRLTNVGWNLRSVKSLIFAAA